MAQSGSSVNRDEVKKFNSLARQWWDDNGPFRALHAYTPTRSDYIEEQTLKIQGKTLQSLTVFDIGCGGGLLSEALAKRGAEVTGFDPAAEVIEVARMHAEDQKLRHLRLNYEALSIEQIARKKRKADIIVCSEVIEHVDHPDVFLKTLCTLTRKNGLIFITTINRTIQSYMLAKVAAEYMFGYVPRGTHDYSKLVRPSELAQWLEGTGLTLRHIQGVRYNPFQNSFSLSEDVAVNYMVTIG